MKNVRIKHTMTNAADVNARYEVDREKGVVRIEVEHIDTYLLLSFLLGLKDSDEVDVLHPAFRVDLRVAGVAYTGKVVKLPEAVELERYTVVLNPVKEG